jgi:signal transduction histidine kinase
MERYLETGEGPVLNQRIEITAVRSNGEEFPVELAITPFQFGGREEFTGFIRDISGRKKAEETLRETEHQLREAHKLEAVGKLAGGIAHDFNNLLTVVIGSSELLETTNDIDEISELGLDIKEAAQRAAQLTKQLLAFSRRQVTELVATDLNTVLSSSEVTLRRLIPNEVQLIVDVTPGLKAVMGDVTQLEQVIMNLVVNSGKAIKGAGHVRVVTRSVYLTSAELVAPDMTPGEYIVLEVRDTGSGMTDEVKARIFEPFYTTAEPGKGTGLGLATVYGIVLQSGGGIHVDSEVGRGTCFSIYFPALSHSAVPSEPSIGTWVPSGGAETILVVEDEAKVRGLVSRILKADGYHVLEASNGHQALVISEQEPRGPIHMLISDILMPNMDGRDLAFQLARSRPNLKVILMSGFAENLSPGLGTSQNPSAFLAKPFVPAELSRLVRTTLDD